MKPRNREINIFNLSMLDVIAGALGAFLILFLVLAPYYEKTSTRPGSGEVPADAEASRRQIGLSYVAGWERRHADVDLWVQVNGVDWRGPQGKSLFGRIRPVFESPDETGGREDTTWWESYRRVDSVDGIYLFAYGAASPASPAPPAGPPGGDASRRATVDGKSPVPGMEVRGTLVIDQGPENRRHYTIRPVRFEQPREVRIAALVRISGDKVEIKEFGDPWTGGELPPRVAQGLAEFRARQSTPTK